MPPLKLNPSPNERANSFHILYAFLERAYEREGEGWAVREQRDEEDSRSVSVANCSKQPLALLSFQASIEPLKTSSGGTFVILRNVVCRSVERSGGVAFGIITRNKTGGGLFITREGERCKLRRRAVSFQEGEGGSIA